MYKIHVLICIEQETKISLEGLRKKQMFSITIKTSLSEYDRYDRGC